MAELIDNTIYKKKIEKNYIELDNGASIEIEPIMNTSGDLSSSNIGIIYEETGKDTESITILMDSSDAYDLIDYISKAKSYNEENLLNAKTSIGYGQSVKDDITIRKEYDNIFLDGTYMGVEEIDFDNPNQERKEMYYHITIPENNVIDVLEAVKASIDVAEEIHECNKNLVKVMNRMKQEMKDEKIEELHFDVYDNNPEPFNKDDLIKVRTISITPYGYDKNPLYTFLRYMYLTGNPKIDYRDNAKQFLMCPFVYSEELLEIGEEFMARKNNDLNEFVKQRYSKK